MKTVIIGAGSFVFSLSAIHDLIIDNRVTDGELALVDVDADALAVMASAARRMSSDAGAGMDVTTHTHHRDALPGAHAVIFSAEVQGALRWKTDYGILARAGMPDQARENGGMGGLLKAFRQCTLAVSVARDMESACPGAPMLVTANPLPRVVSAVSRFTSVPAVGFCNVAWGGYPGYQWLARLVGRPADQLHAVTAGLNHFAWLLELRDRQTGEDLKQVVEQKVRDGADSDFRVLARWLEQYGCVGVSGDTHMAEMLAFDPDIHYHDTPPFHGDSEERRRFAEHLRLAGEGRADFAPLLEHRSWERPADVAAALYSGTDARFDMLNVPNRGSIPQLPDGCIVEVPCRSDDGELKGERVPEFPAPLADLLNRVSRVIEMSAEAAVRGDRDLARQVIETDPAIADKRAALGVLDEMIKAHSDLLPQFCR